MTRIITADNIDEAAKCIKNGGTVVFPTETVYGLGADALNDDAVRSIFTAKGRPADNPLIVHIAHIEDVYKLTSYQSDDAKKLMDAFFPGCLTLIMKKSDLVGGVVTAGLDTVAIRMPSNPIAHELIKKSGCFIAAPSANLSGSPSPTVARHVIDDMNGRVDYIIDGGASEVGLESTVVDVSGDVPEILRPGKITYEELKKVVPDIIINKGILKETDKPKSPGMKYKHYAPKADVTVVMGSKDNVRKYIESKITNGVGVLTYKGGTYNGAYVINAGNSMEEYANGLFYNLRLFDEHGVNTVYAEFADEGGIGLAVKNRLFKSAGHKTVNADDIK